MNDAIDINDLQHIQERFGDVIGWIPGAITKETGKINPQATMTMLATGQWCTVFHVKPVYYETSTGSWRPLSEVTTHHGNKKIILNENWWQIHPRYLNWLDKRCNLIGGELLIPSFISAIPTPYSGIVRSIHESFVPLHIGLTTTTVYPDPSPETTTVDGYIYSEGSSNWATVKAGNSQGAGDSATTSDCRCDRNGGVNYALNRSLWLFDTSAIGDTDTIDSATLDVFVETGGMSGTASFDAFLCATNPASNTAVVVSDWGSFGTTKYSNEFDGSAVTENAYNSFTLNASGLSAISKTGISKFGDQEKNDIENSAPTETTVVSMRVKSADYTGSSSDPKLVVTHSAAASGPANLKSYNTNLKANIKSINTNPIANVKSLNTNV